MNMFTYQNGNCTVQITEDGTKIRTYEGDPRPVYPETCDVKITNYCDNPICSKWCHEKSNMNGIHGNLQLGLEKTAGLPRGWEAAIGGGNPLSHPDLAFFLTSLKNRGHIANLTVNQFHLNRHRKELARYMDERLVNGLGLSMISNTPKVDFYHENMTFHLIAGIHSVEYAENLIASLEGRKARILVLGYKHYGNGTGYYSDTVKDTLNGWFMWLPRLFLKKNLVLSFDNLSITQLKPERFLTKEQWETFYMGDDGGFSCYIDLVKEEFARTSTTPKRMSLHNISSAEEFLPNV